MNPDLIPALIAGGMSAAAAQRIATAINTPVQAPQSSNSQFLRQEGTGYQDVVGEKAAFAVFASAANTQLVESTKGFRFGPGGGALGVSGVSVFAGDIYCSGRCVVGDLTAQGDVVAVGAVTGASVNAGVELTCRGALKANADGVTLTAPVHVQDDLDVRGQAQLNGPVTLNGRVDVKGDVWWANNFRSPQQIDVLTAIDLVGNPNTGDARFTPTSVSVLNNFGNPGDLQLRWAFAPTTKKLTDLIEFDVENCKLKLTKDAVDVVVAGNITITKV